MDIISQRNTTKDAWLGFVRSRFEPAALSQGSSNLHTAKLVEMELAMMSECFAQAKRYRNTAVSGACRLPPEILSSIFILAQEGWDPDRKATVIGPPDITQKPLLWRFTRGWMVVTEVCHNWRNASLGCPALWSQVLCSAVTPLHLPLILARSRQLPLQLRVIPPLVTPGDHANSLSAALKMWMSSAVLRRAKRLEVRGEITQLCWKVIAPLLKTDTPLLKDLEISFESEYTGIYLSNECCALISAPPITRLSLKNCLVQASSPLLSRHLTHLSLCAVDGQLSAAYTTDIRPILANMKHLQELRLADVIPCVVEHGQFDLRLPTCFRQLDVLLTRDAEDTIMPMMHFLSELTLPGAARASYQFDDLIYLDEEIHRIMPGLLSGIDWSQIRAEMCMTSHSLVLRPFVEHHPIDGFVADSRTIHCWSDDHSLAPAYPLRMIRYSSFDEYNSPLGCLRETLPRDKVQALHFDIAVLGDLAREIEAADDDENIEDFSPLSDVRQITIESFLDHHERFFNALSRRGPGTRPSPLLFPRLRTLVFLRSSGLPNKELDDASPEIRRTVAFAEAGLINCLETRAALGSPVEKIFVDRAYSSWTVWASIADGTEIHFVDTRRLPDQSRRA